MPANLSVPSLFLLYVNCSINNYWILAMIFVNYCLHIYNQLNVNTVSLQSRATNSLYSPAFILSSPEFHRKMTKLLCISNYMYIFEYHLSHIDFSLHIKIFDFLLDLICKNQIKKSQPFFILKPTAKMLLSGI